MGGSTELIALPVELPDLVTLQPHFVLPPRDRLDLPCKAGHPERMDNVRRLDRQRHLRPHRDMHLVCRDDAQIGVAKLPPPLMADDRHLEHIRPLRNGRGRCDSRDRGDSDHDQDQHRNDRPDNLEPRVTVNLRRDTVTRPAAEAQGCKEKKPLDEDEENHRHPEDEIIQPGFAHPHRAGRRERALWTSSASRDQKSKETSEQNPDKGTSSQKVDPRSHALLPQAARRPVRHCEMASLPTVIYGGCSPMLPRPPRLGGPCSILGKPRLVVKVTPRLRSLPHRFDEAASEWHNLAGRGTWMVKEDATDPTSRASDCPGDLPLDRSRSNPPGRWTGRGLSGLAHLSGPDHSPLCSGAADRLLPPPRDVDR